LVKNLIENHQLLITIEEGALGGFGSAVSEFLLNENLLDSGKCKLRTLFMKDEFIEQNSQKNMQIEAGLGADKIVEIVEELGIV
jgi:1-deoxy-D-xylulose-5-phosphate synthase